MNKATLSTAIGTVFAGVILTACATPAGEVPSSLDAVNYMDQAAVAEYVTGNTEEFSKGAGYYADDGNISIRWDGKDQAGTYVIREDGQLCMRVVEWGDAEECQQYAEVDGEVVRYYEGKPRASVMKQGNALDAY